MPEKMFRHHELQDRIAQELQTLIIEVMLPRLVSHTGMRERFLQQQRVAELVTDAVFERMLKYTISEDGRLHGEKYFHTVREEFRTTRSTFRWRQLTGLARVTASAYGYDRADKQGGRAPGYEDACRLLKVTA